MKKLLKATLIITIFSVLTRAMGFVLRIYFSRTLSVSALGFYQVAITVFGLFCTIIASGLPLAVSRNVAKHHLKKQYNEEFSNVSGGLVLSLMLTVPLCLIVIAFPNLLNFIFKNRSNFMVLLLMLPGVIASGIYSSFRGALWGRKEFFLLSFTEFVEQLLRIIICFTLFRFTVMEGQNIAGLSLSIACILSSIFAVVMYFSRGGRLKYPKKTILPLIKTSSPIIAVRTASSLIQFGIALIIPLRLMSAGITRMNALALFGIATGMVLPLLMVPSTLIGSLAVAVVPEISEKSDIPIEELHKNKKLKHQINVSVSSSVILSCLLLPFFLTLGEPITVFLFNNALAGKILSYSSFMMIPMGVSGITSSVLNALGLEIKSLKNYIVGAILLFLSIYFLPQYIGIYSLVVGMGLLSCYTGIANLIMLGKRKLLNKNILKSFIFTIIICLPCSLFSKFIYGIFSYFSPMFVSLLFSGLTSLLAMFVFLITLDVIDLYSFLPRSKKLRPNKKQTGRQV